jgi:transposase-like protein
MTKIENPHHIQIELDGTRAKITQSEYELSVDEWYRRRTEAYAQLRRKAELIPCELLDLVEHFRQQNPVQLYVYRPTEKPEVLKIAVGQGEGDQAPRFAELKVADKRLQDEDRKEGMSASDALAFILRMFLRTLKHAEKNREAAPVRTKKLVPRSLIAEIAMDLLETCASFGYPPGPLLNSLVRELLNLDRDRQTMSRDVETQQWAAFALAEFPTVGTRKLAKALDVNPSTISRWRRSPDFQEMIQREAESLKSHARLTDETGASREQELTAGDVLRLVSTVAVLLRRT